MILLTTPSIQVSINTGLPLTEVGSERKATAEDILASCHQPRLDDHGGSAAVLWRCTQLGACY
ncbi:hypothetical protein OH492_19910 [Vibrio chagasii]|nr:hypothetical protein [Vibrio chagasii]